VAIQDERQQSRAFVGADVADTRHDNRQVLVARHAQNVTVIAGDRADVIDGRRRRTRTIVAACRVDEAWIADGHVRRLTAVERGALVGEYPLELARAAIALEQGFPGLPQDRTTHDEAGCRATTLDEDV